MVHKRVPKRLAGLPGPFNWLPKLTIREIDRTLMIYVSLSLFYMCLIDEVRFRFVVVVVLTLFSHSLLELSL